MIPFNPGPMELLIVGVLALLLFGKRLPEVARNLGKGFSEFKKGVSGFENEVRTASNESGRNIDYSSTPERPQPTNSAAETDTEEADEFAAPKFLDD